MTIESYYSLNNYPKHEEQRIKILRIPPNWKDVRINKNTTDKIQVVGIDSRNRQQYIYHPLWVLFTNNSKYIKINNLNFNKFIKVIKNKSKEEIYTKDYMIANMFIIMKDLNIRVGNEIYLKENDSVGLCTMQKKHFKNDCFIFKGKKGVIHEKKLNNIHLNFVNKLLILPGKYLFKYKDDNNFYNVNSTHLNNFLKCYIDENMTSKDIRTYCANQIFKKRYDKLLSENDPKAKINAIKYTANELGNTPKVCRDAYINPSLYSE